ncbi:MAG: hypothetical protein V7L22_09165 [Nostoc sp.]
MIINLQYLDAFALAGGVGAEVFGVVGEAESGLLDNFGREIVESD